jgi:hypothetical protein
MKIKVKGESLILVSLIDGAKVACLRVNLIDDATVICLTVNLIDAVVIVSSSRLYEWYVAM